MDETPSQDQPSQDTPQDQDITTSEPKKRRISTLWQSIKPALRLLWTVLRKWAAVAGLFLLGACWAMIQIDEYALAAFALLVSCIGFSIQLQDWSGIPSHETATRTVQAIGALLIVIMFLFFGGVIVIKKETKPWSNLLRKKLVKEEKETVPNTSPAAITVFEPFAPLYERHTRELGNPKTEAESQRFVYHARHQHGIAIWFDVPGVFYLLNPDTQQWTRIIDPDTVSNQEFHDEAMLMRQFKPPKGLYPPYSGVAKMLARDPVNWSWLGLREAVPHCDYTDGVIRIQEFDGGMIMGGFVRNPQQGDAVGFVLINEGHKWDSRVLPDMPIAICQDPIVRRGVPPKEQTESKDERLRRLRQQALHDLHSRNPQ